MYLWLFLFIFGLFFISVAVAKKLWLLIGFAGYLPVFSCVLTLNSLTINTIHFSVAVAEKAMATERYACIFRLGFAVGWGQCLF